MVENSPLDVSTWSRFPYGLSCIFPYHQIRVDESLLRTVANYWVPSRHLFHLNRIELCPTIEEFVAIMGEPEIDDLIFPTMGRDLPSLLRVLLGVPKTTTNRW